MLYLEQLMVAKVINPVKLHDCTSGYKWLQVVTSGYKWLQVVTSGYK